MIYEISAGHPWGNCPDYPGRGPHISDHQTLFEGTLDEAIQKGETLLTHSSGDPRGWVQVGHRAEESNGIWESTNHYHSDALWRWGERMSDTNPHNSPSGRRAPE